MEALQSTVETIYRVSADDDTLAEIRAREDEIRMQRTIENVMKRRTEIMEEQQATIAANEATIAAQATYIAELEAKLKQLSNQ